MKIGRNQPCPCGSGKKYKLCHALRRESPVIVEDDKRYTTYFGMRVLLQKKVPR